MKIESEEIQKVMMKIRSILNGGGIIWVTER